ncbi:MAG: site-specific integrase [Bacteroidales bacterium]|nr:site-specific integrase [Bacteroidales bacterium]
MAYRIVAHPRKDHVKKDGTTPVYLWVTIDRKTRKYSLGHYIDPKKWDKNKEKLAGTKPIDFAINDFIRDSINNAERIILNIQRKGLTPNFELFERAYKNNTDLEDFYQFAHVYIETGNFSPGYTRLLKGELSKLKKFKDPLRFSDIDHSFIMEYEHYMYTTLKNKANTVTKTMKKIKAIVNEAMRRDEALYTKSPFAKYRMKTEPTFRERLYKEELDHLFTLRGTFSNHINNVLEYFLFSCYTGLRFTDITKLRYSNIQGEWVKVKMEKTKDNVSIPLLKRAKELIPKNDSPLDRHIFPTISNQKTNKYLKTAIEGAGITRKITYHCSRHTFATIALNLGIPKDVVQKILGHSQIRTTDIYAKMEDKTIEREMRKMEV